MSVNKVDYRQNKTAHTGRGPSPNVWGKFPTAEVLADPGRGIYIFEDFLRGGLITAPTTAAALVGIPYSGFSSSASQISYGTAAYTSSVNDAGTLILAETTTRESTSFRSDIVPFRISANFGFLAAEFRIKISTVATNEISFFVGLFEEETLTVDIPIIASGADTHLMSDKNWVGFHKPIGDTTTFDGAYKANGVTQVTSNDGLGTLAADTYIKLGFTFDPPDGNKLTWFVNGIPAATQKVVPDNTGTDFPADVPLGPVIGMSVGTGASDNTLTCDWFGVGQLFV